MKLNFQFFLILSVALITVFVVLVSINKGQDIRYIILGLAIGSGLRSLHEYFKEQKQTPEK
jgi:ABC-type enterobactin transport system permease subunit